MPLHPPMSYLRFSLRRSFECGRRSLKVSANHKEFGLDSFASQVCLRTRRPFASSRSSSSLAKPARLTSHHWSRGVGLGTLATVIWLAAAFSLSKASLHAEAPPNSDDAPEGRLFRLSELKSHGKDAERYWVVRGDRVYDITEWVPSHPGGEVILRAAGSDVTPFWKIFTIHQKKDVYEILEQYFIGKVDPRDLVDGHVPSDSIEDPFKDDPDRDGRLLVHSDRPCNAETPADALQSFITSNALFYVRNHLWVPQVKLDDYKLLIDLPDGTEKEYSLKELQDKFKECNVTATMQCSGNRRKHMTEASRATNGLQWDVGAISTAEWTGVRLRDVLADCGVDVTAIPDGVEHAQFTGSEAYGASIPIDKALDPRGDVLLAYKMNGQALPPDHGYPLRVVVPGTVAARSVKWVNKISLSDEESTSQWQRRDYKCFGPNEGSNPDWASATSIQETPVQSAITAVKDVSTHSPRDRKLVRVYGLEEDSVIVEGYAFSGGGRGVVRVDVSVNGGHTWSQAELLKADDAKGCKSWAWRQWKFIVPRREVGRVIVVKAVDEAYNTQPDSYEAHYNFRGNLTSGWHRVPYLQKSD